MNARTQLRPDRWQDAVKPFRKPSRAGSIWQLVNTVGGYLALWVLAIMSLEGPYLVTLGLAILAGGMTVRAFIINHDCGHGSFFKSRRANDIVGFWTGLIAYTPYLQWRHGHALHHAKSGQIEERGVGYFWIMTLDEYNSASPGVRFGYRLYRNPFVLFLLGGFWLFVFEFRLSFRSVNKRMRRQVYLANLTLAAIFTTLGLIIGWLNLLSILLPIVLTAAIVGLALFYVQHHYEDSYWAPEEQWDYREAALGGSSYLKMPRLFEWWCGSINYHHIHHLAPKIPNYRLREAHHAIPMFRQVQPLSWRDIRSSWRCRLVDESTGRWVDIPRGARAAEAAELASPERSA